MAENSFPFDHQPTYQDGWEKMATLWRPNGVIEAQNLLRVTANSSGMHVFVDTGIAWFNGFFYENTVSKVLPIAAASAQDRIDRVVLRLTGTAISTIVLPGLPAAVPVAPGLSSGPVIFDLLMAQVYVHSTAVNIAAGDVTAENFLSGQSVWNTPGMLNAWVVYDPVGFRPAQYKLSPDGLVTLRGVIKNGALGTIFVLPYGYRPTSREIFTCAALSGTGRVDVLTDGSVQVVNYEGTGNNGFLSLSNVGFSTT